MTSIVALFLIAVAAGIAVALQGQFMGVVNRSVGTATTMLVTYGGGAIISAAIWLFRRPPAAAAESVPWYGWTAGALGLVIVGGIGYAAPRLGLSRTLVITVAAQLGAALVLESLGLFGATQRPLDASKLAGIALTVAGVWLVVK
ncbi:MAG TPA: DMT family transporter [Thermoanaerobaculia bacterium]